jgi:endonuclease/exonuclease/phosphatase (EEP) superfamily protein YafD
VTGRPAGRVLHRAGSGPAGLCVADRSVRWAERAVAGGLAGWAERAAAGGLAGWAAARLAGADRAALAPGWAVPVLSFTPQAAAAAWASVLLMRGRGTSTTAALAAAALTAAVAGRTVRKPGRPADGPPLRLLTGNLLAGRADAATVIGLVGSTAADVLLVQELTDDAVERLRLAGLPGLLPHQVIMPAERGALGSGIYARYPLSEGLPLPAGHITRCSARLQLPGGGSAQLVCVHLPPPKAPLSPRATASWRAELAALPVPGADPVILAGDFNSTLDHAAFRGLLRRGYADAAARAGRGLDLTWGPGPRGRPALLTIDHVLADRRCAVRRTSVHQLPGSDHRALFAELRLPG